MPQQALLRHMDQVRPTDSKKITDPDFSNQHWCSNEDCTEGSDVGSPIQSPSVRSNVQCEGLKSHLSPFPD